MTTRRRSATGSDPAPAAARLLGVAEVGLGLVVATRANRVATGRWWVLDRRAMRAVVTVLGAREIAQGLVTVARPRRDVVLAGAGVDLLHAASMLPVALAGGDYRRASAVSATLALTAAAAAAVLSSGGRRP